MARTPKRPSEETAGSPAEIVAGADPVPKDLRPADEVAAELRRRTKAAVRAVFAAFEAATAPDDETERIARLFDCAATSARGANELRSLHLRISDKWGEHPGLGGVAWACGLLAACQACAWSAAMQDEYLNDESPVWVDGVQHWVGLEFCVRKRHGCSEAFVRMTKRRKPATRTRRTSVPAL